MVPRAILAPMGPTGPYRAYRPVMANIITGIREIRIKINLYLGPKGPGGQFPLYDGP